ncbi:MAG: hypothetical protein LIO96_00180, partial [Lachnospiraceae bacterium]|nr:hypothetical protein [Lachnospiraceae bacterium]
MKGKKWISVVLAFALIFQAGAIPAAAQEMENMAGGAGETVADDTADGDPVDEAAADDTVDGDPVDEAAVDESGEDLTDEVESGTAENDTDNSTTENNTDSGTTEDGNAVRYINGYAVDYGDPDCVEYLENMEQSEETDADDDADFSVQSTASGLNSSSGISTSWNGTTYYHNENIAENANISMGIDVSRWQGDIDWEAVSAAGVEFAFIRLGYRDAYSGKIYSDDCYSKNRANAAAAGVSVGIYFRSQAITVAEANAEADYVIQQLGSYTPDLPVVIDFEFYDGGRTTSLSKAEGTATCNAFCAKIEAAGYDSCVYANKSTLTGSLNAADFGEDCEVWLAEWKSKATYAGDYSFWQCSSTASVSGISGNVDLDWWYDTYKVTGDVVRDSSTGEWWYVDDDGNVDKTYTGFAKNSNGWWYIEEGKVTFQENSVIYGSVKGKNGWWYVVGSKVQLSFTGLADYANKNGWWYIKNGKVDFTKNTVAKNKNGWWYVTGGKVQFGYTGLSAYANVTGSVSNLKGNVKCPF